MLYILYTWHTLARRRERETKKEKEKEKEQEREIERERDRERERRPAIDSKVPGMYEVCGESFRGYAN